MLLDEDPAGLIHECTSNFSVDADKAALGRIENSRDTLVSFRQYRMNGEQMNLQKLTRKLGSLQSQHSLATQSHNPAEHAAEILRLDTQKFKVAKQVSDLEIEEERLMQELDRLKGELEELEAQGVEGGDLRKVDVDDEDAVLLKLRIYRSLGIHPEADPTSGNYTKATIHNTKKGDAHFVSIDPKFSRFFYSNYIWDRV